MSRNHNGLHGDPDTIHKPYAWIVADMDALNALTGLDSSMVGHLAYVTDGGEGTGVIYQLLSSTGVWEQVGGASAFPSGTKMLFVQTVAPDGWTKDTTHDNKALRVVTGAAGSGGSVDFSTLFARTSTDSHTLTSAQIPSHTHSVSVLTNTQGDTTQSNLIHASTVYNDGDTGSRTTGAAGSGGAHSHNIDMRVKYVDVIICTKD